PLPPRPGGGRVRLPPRLRRPPDRAAAGRDRAAGALLPGLSAPPGPDSDRLGAAARVPRQAPARRRRPHRREARRGRPDRQPGPRTAAQRPARGGRCPARTRPVRPAGHVAAETFPAGLYSDRVTCFTRRGVSVSQGGLMAVDSGAPDYEGGGLSRETNWWGAFV